MAFGFRLCRRLLTLLVIVPLGTVAGATENAASVYPVGVDTVLPGITPPPGATQAYEFTTFYSSSRLIDSHGHSSVPGFKMQAFANALRVGHNWNVRALGGSLNSTLAIPVVYQRLNLAGKQFSKAGVGNIAVSPVQIGYLRGSWHWSVEAALCFPGLSYSKSDPLNIGQHNFAAGPAAAFTYLPRAGNTEVSSKLQYLVNGSNPDTHYRSGHELTAEYAVMQRVAGPLSLGVNGYFYQQTTADTQNGMRVADGFRGRDLAIGPQLRLALGARTGLILKYQRDTLVRNRCQGAAVWFQLSFPVPLGRAN